MHVYCDRLIVDARVVAPGVRILRATFNEGPGTVSKSVGLGSVVVEKIGMGTLT